MANSIDPLKLDTKMVQEKIDLVEGKTREQIVADREEKKVAKQEAKQRLQDQSANSSETSAQNKNCNHELENEIKRNNAEDDTAKKEITNCEKTREQILAEREAKKLAKQLKTKVTFGPSAEIVSPEIMSNISAPASMAKTRDEIIAEREAKKLAKQSAKKIAQENCQELTKNFEMLSVETDKKKSTTKAERRAIQEAQRAAKAKITNPVKVSAKIVVKADVPAIKPKMPEVHPIQMNSKKSHECKIKLFNHLKSSPCNPSNFINDPHIHPIMVRLGEQYAKRTIVGSNARCLAFLNALKTVIQDFQTPPKKEFARSLEVSIKFCVDHLHKCRPLAVSVSNAYKHIKHILTQLPTDKPETELKEKLCHFIETYIENQIDKAAQSISTAVQEKISDGDVILTFGCSSLIDYILEEAHRRHVDFRVIVVDARPFLEGQELLRRLTDKEIPCTYVLINAVSFVMPDATKILLGAHALLSNGHVMARIGTAQVALVARSFNVPVLVCCETHKFSESSQTDAIVCNELGNPDDLILSEKCSLVNWQSKNLSPLNLNYDITPPELVTAVVTDFSILPCSSAPVILRIKPTEIGYSH